MRKSKFNEGQIIGILREAEGETPVNRGRGMNGSHEVTKSPRDKEAVASIILGCAFQLHGELGPGLGGIDCPGQLVLATDLRKEKTSLKSVQHDWRG